MSDKYIEIVEAIEDVLKQYEDILNLYDQDTYEIAEMMLRCYLEGDI